MSAGTEAQMVRRGAARNGGRHEGAHHRYLKVTFLTALVAAFAGAGMVITAVLGLVPHQAHRAAG